MLFPDEDLDLLIHPLIVKAKPPKQVIEYKQDGAMFSTIEWASAPQEVTFTTSNTMGELTMAKPVFNVGNYKMGTDAPPVTLNALSSVYDKLFVPITPKVKKKKPSSSPPVKKNKQSTYKTPIK